MGVTAAAEGRAEAYGIYFPPGCGQIRWRSDKPAIPEGSKLTDQARIICKDCKNLFVATKGTCSLYQLHPSDCKCIGDPAADRGWVKRRNRLEEWLVGSVNGDIPNTHGNLNDV